VVQVWNQKVRLDGTPVEEATTDYELTFDEDGNLIERVEYGPGQQKTTYFLVKGERVSKSAWIGEDPTAKMPLLKGMKRIKKKNGPFDYRYKYIYDKNGRIGEISGQDVEGVLKSSVKYVYDDAGRIVSETDRSGWNLVNEIIRSFKYDDKGNIIELASKTSMHLLKGTGKNYQGGPYVATEKDEATVRYSGHTVDKNGNWTQRTATTLNSQGKIVSVVLEVRYFAYF